MLGQSWYNGSIRKYVALFGTIFNDVYIERVDSNGNEVKTIKIPVAYGPKERYLTREEQNPDLLRPVNQVWPRMAFEITDIRYDSDRKLNTLKKNTTGSSSSGTLNSQLNPVPYNIAFKLTIISRNTEDGMRIVEQILPYFTPALNVSIDIIPEMNYGPITIPLILNNVNQEELYENSFENKEYVLWTLNFTMKSYVYGPLSSGAVIKEININFEGPSGFITPSIIGTLPPNETVYVRPGLTANGQPTSDANTTIPVANIYSNSNYGIISEILGQNYE